MDLHIERKHVTADVNLRVPSRTKLHVHEAPLAMPQWDDEDDNSSDDDQPPTRDNHGDASQDDDNQPPPPLDPAAFNWDGVGDIQALQLKNSELVATIKDYKHHVTELQLLLEAVEPIPGLDVNTLRDVLQGAEVVDHDIRDVKIVHQAKKLRQAKIALTKEKSKGAGASGRIAELERQLHDAEERHLKSERLVHKLQLGEKPEPKHTESANTVPLKKFEDLRVKYEAMAIDLKKTQRALQREVGDDVPLAEILDGEGGGKRGRAQQIVMLKAKVKKLEKELQTRTAPDTGVDAKAEVELLALKADKQRQLDHVVADLDALKDANDKLSRKYDAQKARMHTLEKDAGKHKTKLAILLDKSHNDDSLIDALQHEMDDLRRQISTNASALAKDQLHRARTADSGNIIDATNTVEALRTKCLEQKRQLAHQASTIESFRRDLQQAQKLESTKIGVNGMTDTANHQALAIEKERLVELVKSLQHQLTDAKKADAAVAPPPKPEIRSRLPRLNGSDSADVDKLRRAIEAKDEEIGTWKDALEQATKASAAQTNSRLVADLEEENERLRDQVDELKKQVVLGHRPRKHGGSNGSS
ncbi:hypothetical protein H257_00385 [Aphanomyces astaci]|uniref:Uncharacterized protein n=1 Tax=Aphanomyces astaci TaxID=112090 RepID=W4HAH4_APHAT|nr:hypothetical protein H257_00385 [Aphanomyces astaci]ETV88952.1 hypothetical protein H257_00385 [Aphanomyces astaci]|eukprot:XP_009821352.1 hypothetical protein H257_00385 [Aphanomyces astaci]